MNDTEDGCKSSKLKTDPKIGSKIQDVALQNPDHDDEEINLDSSLNITNKPLYRMYACIQKSKLVWLL